jgi:hypothetical protein
MAAAPEIISMSSPVMTDCLVLLKVMVSFSIISSAMKRMAMSQLNVQNASVLDECRGTHHDQELHRIIFAIL